MKQTVKVIDKHPWAIIQLAVDWTIYAADVGNPAITDAVWEVTPTSALTLSMEQVSGYQSSILIAGGTDGTSAFVSNKVTFFNGIRDVFIFEVAVSDKAA